MGWHEILLVQQSHHRSPSPLRPSPHRIHPHPDPEGGNSNDPTPTHEERQQIAATLFTYVFGGSFFVMIYYLPNWFQAVQGVSAMESGIRNLPFLLGTTVMTIVSGAMITILWWHTPWAFFCTSFMAVGAGLMTTLKVDSGAAKWFGYQVRELPPVFHLIVQSFRPEQADTTR